MDEGPGAGHGTPSLIGRRAERHTLEEWTREAWSGRLRIVTVSGSAGVGKTALVDAMVPTWFAQGARVLSSTCHEDLAVPYLPLLSAIGAPAASPAGASGRPVSLIDRMPEQFVALTDALVDAARSGRTVLRIDDVHWADPATVHLLGHLVDTVVRHAGSDRLDLLVVLGRRDAAPGSPLARLVDRIRREPSHRHLVVGCLDELGVDELLGTILGRRPSRHLLSEVHDVTEGNPLFVRELVEHLRRQDGLDVRDGEVVGRVRIDAGRVELGSVLGGRIDVLLPTARAVLTTAAHLGDGQSIGELRHFVDVDEASFERAMDELDAVGLLIEHTDDRYEFAHDTVRQLLYGATALRARQREHLRIAKELMAWAGEDDERTLRIAHHLRRAGPNAPRSELYEYARRAVGIAMSMGAWAKAASSAELALETVSVDSDGTGAAQSLALHVDAATAHFRNHDAPAATAHSREAIRLAVDAGDLDAWGRALLVAHRSELTLTDRVDPDLHRHRELLEYLDVAGEAVPSVRARCWLLLAEVASTAGDMEIAHDAVRAAHSLAVRLGDDVLLAEVTFAEGLARFAALEPLEAAASFEASARAARAGADDWILAWPLGRLALTHVLTGDLSAAQHRASEAVDLAVRTQHWAEQGLVTAASALLALATNDLGRCERESDDALALFARSSYPFIASLAWPLQAYLRALRLDRLGAQEALRTWRASGVRGANRFEILVDALTLPAHEFAGRVDIDRYQPAARSPTHAFSAGGLAIDVEIGVRLGATAMVADAAERLDDLSRRGVTMLLPVGASVDRLRGMARVAAGDLDGGLALLVETARSLHVSGATVEGLRTELEHCLALTRLGIDDSVERLAVDLGRRLDEASLLGPLQRLREHLPDPVTAAMRLDRTVVCWDMVGSTDELVAGGDEAFVELVHEMNELIHRRLDQYRGVAFKHTGDGIFAWFLDRRDALHAAMDVAADLDAQRPAPAMRLRTGMAFGQPVDDAGDLFGIAVVLAARLCDRADDGQILCTAETVAGLETALPVSVIGALQLKGFPDDVEVVALERS